MVFDNIDVVSFVLNFLNNNLVELQSITDNLIFLNKLNLNSLNNLSYLYASYLQNTLNIELFNNNSSYIQLLLNNSFTFNNLFVYLIYFLNKFFKITLFLIIIYTIFFITTFENYIKQLVYSSSIAKFFILNENEKEIGPVDDYFFFVILFVLTLCSFVFISIFFIIIQTKVLIWTVASLILVAILILSVPVNLFLDFGISFFAYIKGSASGGNFIKEVLFDIISTTTVFIRFVIQNIRFLFIFSAIFELLEWVFSTTSTVFFFFNPNEINNYFVNTSNTNLLIVNFLMFIILYFYYTLHLLFLLLVQITIYIGISAWLFFFLYSTKFLNKYEKFFSYKK